MQRGAERDGAKEPSARWQVAGVGPRDKLKMPKLFVIAGAILMGIGLLLWAGLPLGKLPGDFMVRRGSVSFYFPLATSIVISIVLTLLMIFFRR